MLQKQWIDIIMKSKYNLALYLVHTFDMSQETPSQNLMGMETYHTCPG